MSGPSMDTPHPAGGAEAASSLPHVVVLGAGPAGLGAAYRLAKTGVARATVIEQRDAVGGNAGSFSIAGITADYGSHRLHPECAPEVLADLRRLIGEDLVLRRRHGRIRLRDRWVHFPLKPLDLALHLPPPFAAGALRDALLRPLRRTPPDTRTFADVMERNLGPAICQDFYFPYARKIWGIGPEELSPVQAQKRVSANSPAKLLRKALGAVPGLGATSSRSFYYPRRGYGQISQCLYEAGQHLGVSYLLGTRVTGVERSGSQAVGVWTEAENGPRQVKADHVWSTLPMPLLARLMQPAAPSDVLTAASQMEFRAMVLVYIVLATPQFTPFDAHYFPEEHIPVSRLSEPKNYSMTGQPSGKTVLCAELPCAPDSEIWAADGATLGGLVKDALRAAGLPVDVPVLDVVAHKLRYAYPVYRLGFEQHFDVIDRWLGTINGLLTFGRQGLFAHDNAHHALDMAYSAVQCLLPDGTFDRERWGRFRVAFEANVVVD